MLGTSSKVEREVSTVADEEHDTKTSEEILDCNCTFEGFWKGLNLEWLNIFWYMTQYMLKWKPEFIIIIIIINRRVKAT